MADKQPPKVKSIDDYVINRKAWRMLEAHGDRVEQHLINLRAPGVLALSD